MAAARRGLLVAGVVRRRAGPAVRPVLEPGGVRRGPGRRPDHSSPGSARSRYRGGGPGPHWRARRLADPVLGLPAVRRPWRNGRDCVFVHLDPDPDPTLASGSGEFPDKIGGFRPDRLVEVARHRFDLAANWKFFVENHVDVYHLWYLHGGSLGDYDHHAARWEMCGPHWVFYEPPARGVDVTANRSGGACARRAMWPEDRWGSGAHLVFPNLTLATGAGFFMTYQCIPDRPRPVGGGHAGPGRAR